MASSSSSPATSASICAHSTTAGAGATRSASERGQRGVTQRVLVDVEDVDEGLGREQVQVAQQRRRRPRRPPPRSRWCALRPGCARAASTASTVAFSDGSPLRLPGQPGQPLLDRLEVGQDQLGVHRLDVAGRVDAGVDVDDVVVVEGAHHLADGVGLPDGSQELVPQPLPLRGPAHQAGDVHEGDRGRHDRGAVVERGQPLRAGGRARPPRRRWARWWRTGSWPPAPRCGSAR